MLDLPCGIMVGETLKYPHQILFGNFSLQMSHHLSFHMAQASPITNVFGRT
jgi:hypothetical protein